MTRTKQEITIHGEFEVTEDMLGQIGEFLEKVFDCELYAISRRPDPALEKATLEDLRPLMDDEVPCVCPYDCDGCHRECCG